MYKPVQITETDLTIKEHYQKTFNVNSQSGEYFTYSLSSLDNVEYVNLGLVTRTWSESVVLKGKAQGNAQLKVTAFLDSDGNKIESPKLLRKAEAKLKKNQRKLSRKESIWANDIIYYDEIP